MKQSRLQTLLVASLLFAGSQLAMGGTVEVSLGGVTYSLDSESQTAAIKSAKDVSGDIVLPESVSYGDKAYALTSVGEEAFAECSDITSLSVPSGVTSIGVHAFYGCSSLASVNIPSGVTSIEEGTFEECGKLASIDIPNGVKTIGHHAFYSCWSLTSAAIPNSVDSIGDWAFMDCSGLTSVDIPSSVKYIGECAFYWCKSLTSVDIPSGVTSICPETFYFCRNLTSVTIPSSVTNIGDKAFYGCDNLTSLDIPSSVKSIGERAFSECIRLTSVTLRSSAVSLEEQAFYFSSIKDVYIYGSEMVENCGDKVFANIEDDATLHVDASLVDKYKATSPWCDWFADIVALDGETGIEKAEADTPSPCRIYSVDGKSLPTMQKGLNILRSKTGKSVKVMK